MRRLLACLLLATGCLAPGSEPVNERSGAVGEPANGFPSALERLGLMAINRARSDPQTVTGPQSTSYPARPPVIWSAVLNQSARFHSVNLETSNVTLMHTSPCPLNTNVATTGCTGDPSCACASPVPSMCAACAKAAATNTCGTDPFVRIGYFTSGSGVGASGEVAAAGYGDPIAVVDGWMDEAAGNDGHRKILTDQGTTANTMGYGHASGANCWKSFDVGDSGNLKNATIPKIPTAAVSPASSAAGTFTFYSTWADPSLGAPASIDVVVDGSCTALTRELGTDKLNATYKGTATLAAGCHNYFILARDASGATVTYPTTGAITVAVGSSTCSSDYVATAPTASCAGDGGVVGGGTGGSGTGTGGAIGTGGAGGKTGTGGAIGTGGAGGKTGTGGSTATGGAGGKTGTGGSGTGGAPTGTGGASTGGATGTGTGGSAGPGGAGGGTKTADNSGCGCDVGTNSLPSTTAGLLMLALLLLLRRGPQRRRVRGG
jgi:MYXO-CTERM domain-containing protein